MKKGVFYWHNNIGDYMEFYKRAIELKEETIKHRRFLHKNAESGLNMPIAVSYLTEELTKIGLPPKRCGEGVVAELGKGRPIILLRADMDALPMKEESELEFASKTNCAHTCGHDLHTAMLLTAAKMLKETEQKLKGTVRFMFQPSEENLTGCKNMIENGLFEKCLPDFSLAFHVGAGKIPVGAIMYNSDSVMMYGADRFKITVFGKGGHGAMPNLNSNPIKVAVDIYKAFEELTTENTLITIGRFLGGDTDNIIPDKTEIGGSLRTEQKEKRDIILQEMKKRAENIASKNGCSIDFTLNASVPPLVCDKKFTQTVVSYIRELNIPEFKEITDVKVTASDDFAIITDKVPSAYIYLASGFSDERGEYTAHNPKVMFNEDVCPIGAASYAYCAKRLLSQ